CKVNETAVAFVDIDEDTLPLDGFLAEPHRLSEFRVGRRRKFPACLAPGPACLEIAAQQLKLSQVAFGSGVSGIEQQNALIRGDGLVEAVKLRQYEGRVLQ